MTQQSGIDYDFVTYYELCEIVRLCDLKNAEEDDDLKNICEFLRDRLIDGRIDESLITSWTQELGWNLNPSQILSAIIPNSRNMMNGEFGEVLTEAILTSNHQYEIPIKKRRYALQGNQSLPSHDTLAIKVENDEIEEVCYIESKLRNKKDYDGPTEAYEGLKRKYAVDIPEIVFFNLQRMKELDHPLLPQFKKYLKDRRQNKNMDTFWIGLTWDLDIWNNTMSKKIERMGSENVPKTSVHLVKIKDLENVVLLVFSMVRSKYE